MTHDHSPAAALADGVRRGRIEAKARTAGTADHELEQLRAERDRLASTIQALTEAVILWRDRPGGDIGLAIALSSILDAEQPDQPAATAIVRVLRECDRLERASVLADGTPPTGRERGVVDAVSRIRSAVDDPAAPAEAAARCPDCGAVGRTHPFGGTGLYWICTDCGNTGRNPATPAADRPADDTQQQETPRCECGHTEDEHGNGDILACRECYGWPDDPDCKEFSAR